MSNVGQPLDRTDGLLKVTGQARYSAEFQVPRLVHAVLVQSTVPAGRITRVDTHVAQAMPGVLLVMTHENAPRLPNDGKPALEPPAGRVLSLLQDDQVHYNGQPVAVVVGDTLEHAQAAARMVRVEVAQQPARLDFETARADAHSPGKVQTQSADTMRGDMASGMAQAAQRIEAIYGTPMEAHNPMEPHATIAVWEGDSLTLYDSTQYVSGVRRTVGQIARRGSSRAAIGWVRGRGHAPADARSALAHAARLRVAARPAEALGARPVAGSQGFARPRDAFFRVLGGIVAQAQFHGVDAKRVGHLIQRDFQRERASGFAGCALEGGRTDVQTRQPMRRPLVGRVVKHARDDGAGLGPILNHRRGGQRVMRDGGEAAIAGGAHGDALLGTRAPADGAEHLRPLQNKLDGPPRLARGHRRQHHVRPHRAFAAEPAAH